MQLWAIQAFKLAKMKREIKADIFIQHQCGRLQPSQDWPSLHWTPDHLYRSLFRKATILLCVWKIKFADMDNKPDPVILAMHYAIISISL